MQNVEEQKKNLVSNIENQLSKMIEEAKKKAEQEEIDNAEENT